MNGDPGPGDEPHGPHGPQGSRGRHESHEPTLAAAWRELAGTEPEAVAVGTELLDRWSEPHRRYHTVAHLRDTLAAAERLRAEARDHDAVRYALWFHDAVYEGRPLEDEEESAALARRLLTLMGTPSALVAEVSRLVLLTRTHRPEAGDADGAVVCDADLSVLAGTPDAYLTYAAAIRAEYGHVPDDAFRQGRLGVLRDLLAAPHLYRTRYGREHWEARARSNLLAEVHRWESGAELPPL
ncbi:HD domain-containing protein [Nocardiopsis aegyptia]|uniref:Putative metal-dependent HD superfamily phosphohydrolase n=1 Tax=Nocardiopsis aegyptia TaxID=220378 RepID=A0A7Z0EKQ5_9ACTN|nr:putative metal-dependent HD superfamily phosphohydrolase [Nocardiopsis aegyptia]